MSHRIEVTATARDDIRETARWLRDQASPETADRWLDGLFRAMSTLERQPMRCPLAAESDKFPEEIRELLYGRKKGGKYRILFKIDGQAVIILYIRHAARDEIGP